MRRRALSAAIACFLACACACAPAAGDEGRTKASVVLLGGYAAHVDFVLNDRRPNPYGAAFGARWGATLARVPVYLGGTFVSHLGSLELASDAAGTSTYRGSYHRTYFGPEVGVDLHAGPVLVRPWFGAGSLIAVNRTSTAYRERNDDALLFYVAPGVFGGVELERWLVGIDLRMPIVPVEPSNRAWAPAVFVAIGQHW